MFKRRIVACLAVFACLALAYAGFRIGNGLLLKLRARQDLDLTEVGPPEDVRVYASLREACATLKSNDLADAERILRDATATYPDSEAVQLGFGVLLLGTGQWVQADAQFRRTLEVLTRHKQYEDVAILRRTLKNLGDRAWLSYYLGRKAHAYQESGDRTRTELMARLSIVLLPSDAYSWTILGGVLEQLGRYDEQERAYRMAAALAPNSAYAAGGLGGALFFLGRPVESEQWMRKAVDLDPSVAQLQNDFAASLLELGRLDESEVHLREAMRLDPGLAMPHTTLAEILLKRGKPKEAEAELREAVRLAPLRYKTHNGLGEFLMRQDRLDEAEVEFREALRLEPASSDIACNLGQLYWRREMLVEAEQQYRKAVRLANGYARASKDLAWFLFTSKAQQLDNEGRFCEEEDTYREVLSLSTNFAIVYNNLGNLLIADTNRWEEAETLIRESLQCAHTEETGWPLASLGELLALQPLRRAEAVAAYREALTAFSAAGKTDKVDQVLDSLNRLETQ